MMWAIATQSVTYRLAIFGSVAAKDKAQCWLSNKLYSPARARKRVQYACRISWGCGEGICAVTCAAGRCRSRVASRCVAWVARVALVALVARVARVAPGQEQGP